MKNFLLYFALAGNSLLIGSEQERSVTPSLAERRAARSTRSPYQKTHLQVTIGKEDKKKSQSQSITNLSLQIVAQKKHGLGKTERFFNFNPEENQEYAQHFAAQQEPTIEEKMESLNLANTHTASMKMEDVHALTLAAQETYETSSKIQEEVSFTDFLSSFDNSGFFAE